MIDVGLGELRIHVGIKFLFGHGAVVVGVHRGKPFFPSGDGAGRFLTMCGRRDANNCSYRQNCTACPVNARLFFKDDLQKMLRFDQILHRSRFILFSGANQSAGAWP
jgi:hypothetical protein